MKTKDAVYTLGMMLGLGGTYVVLKAGGMESHIMRLIIAVIAGAGIGYLSERVYSSNQNPPGKR